MAHAIGTGPGLHATLLITCVDATRLELVFGRMELLEIVPMPFGLKGLRDIVPFYAGPQEQMDCNEAITVTLKGQCRSRIF